MSKYISSLQTKLPSKLKKKELTTERNYEKSRNILQVYKPSKVKKKEVNIESNLAHMVMHPLLQCQRLNNYNMQKRDRQSSPFPQLVKTWSCKNDINTLYKLAYFFSFKVKANLINK